MGRYGTGVADNSELYFLSPSSTAKKLYFYVTDAGHYYCEKGYHIKRDQYKSHLLLHVCKGIFTYISDDGQKINVKENETILLNCHKPHQYYTDGPLEIVWAHIGGVNLNDIVKEAEDTGRSVSRCKDSEDIKNAFLRLIDYAGGRKILSEPYVSLLIYRILTEMMEYGANSKNNRLSDNIISAAKEYLIEHIGEKITVSDIAAEIHISQSHFTRLFKQHTGFSPYSYILVCRLNKAKELLHTTDKSISEIAYDTGFNSDANFIYTFTKNVGISPGKFKKMKF